MEGSEEHRSIRPLSLAAVWFANGAAGSIIVAWFENSGVGQGFVQHYAFESSN